MAKKPGMFVVDLSALNLSQSALGDIEKAINATVQKQVGGLDLTRKLGKITTQQPPPWWGIIYIPPPQIKNQ